MISSYMVHGAPIDSYLATGKEGGKKRGPLQVVRGRMEREPDMQLSYYVSL